MEVVADRSGVMRNLPLLTRVVATNPSRWGSWVRALRHGDRAY